MPICSMNSGNKLPTMGQLSASLGLCVLFFPFNRECCLLYQISQTQIMLSKNSSIRFHRSLTPIQKASPLAAFQLQFFFLHDSKNKFVLWARDDEFDRFSEQKIKEKLAVSSGGDSSKFHRTVYHMWGGRPFSQSERAFQVCQGLSPSMALRLAQLAHSATQR